MKKSRYISIFSFVCALTCTQASASSLHSFLAGFVAFSTTLLSRGDAQTFGYYKLGGGNADDFISGMVLDTSDDAFYLAGYSKSTGFTTGKGDALFVKYNNTGVLQGANTYHNEGGVSQGNVFNAIAILTNNQIIMGGYTKNFGAILKDWFFIRTDFTGAVYSADGYVSSLTYNEEVESLAPTSDYGWISAGWQETTTPDKEQYAIIARYATAGSSVIWGKRITGGHNDVFKGVAVNPDSGATDLTAVGYTESFGSTKGLLVVNLNSTTGALNWAACIDGTDTPGSMNIYFQEGYDVIYDHAGNIYIAGYAYALQFPEPGSMEDYAMLLKLDSATGAIQWKKLFGAAGRPTHDKLYALDYDSVTDTVAFAGYTEGYGTTASGVMVGTVDASTGNMNWLNVIDGTNDGQPTGVQFNSAHDVVVTGWTLDDNSAGGIDYFIAKLKGDDGTTDCATTTTYGGYHDADWITAVDITNHADLTITDMSIPIYTERVYTDETLPLVEYEVCPVR